MFVFILFQDHFLFQKPAGHLMVNSGAVRDWPDARGIWWVDSWHIFVDVKSTSHSIPLVSLSWKAQCVLDVNIGFTNNSMVHQLCSSTFFLSDSPT